MPSPEQLAGAHYRDRVALVRAVAADARRLWRQVDRADIRSSWRALAARLLITLTGAQLAAARQADEYTSGALDAQGIDAQTSVSVQPRALAGVASDGRDLATLLEQPAIGALVALAGGTSVARSMATGYASLDMIVRTQVADAGRVADGVALMARPHVAGYVRMVVGKTCSRCIILAGRWYPANRGFRRHPSCDCIHIPAAEDAEDLRTDPRKIFDSMSPAEQDKAFTKAGAEAIRAGSDMNQVVNARRGMQTAADGRLYTTEAAGRRPRLMPEQIYRDAKDRDDAIRLLRLHGYIH